MAAFEPFSDEAGKKSKPMGVHIIWPKVVVANIMLHRSIFWYIVNIFLELQTKLYSTSIYVRAMHIFYKVPVVYIGR